MPPLLVVEDDELIRNVVKRALARHHIDAVYCCDAEEARQAFLLHGHAFIGALIDIKLNGQNGELLAAELLLSQPALRIVLMSGIDVTDLNVLDDHPNVTFLPKPFLVDDLVTKVKTLLTLD